MKTKSIIILIITLIIGFAIGFFTNSQLTKQKIQTFIKMGTPDGFKERLYRIIRPDETQREEIGPILEKYADKIHEALIDSREEMKNINDDMVRELRPFLNDDQVERMLKVHERLGRGWGDHRPPGSGHRKGNKKERR